jgi:hypothetical protein
MQLVGVILLLISIGLVVGPVGAVIYVYKDDLSGLILPPEVKNIVNGDVSLFKSDISTIDGENSSPFSSFVEPEFVSANIDKTARIFSVTVSITNSFETDLTLNHLNLDVETPDHQHVTTASLEKPLTIHPSESALATVVGSWTQSGESYFLNQYSSDEPASIVIVKAVVDVNGIAIELSEPIQISVPLSLSGVTITG